MPVHCEFCSASLCDKYNLKRHQETSKKCIARREREKIKDTEETEDLIKLTKTLKLLKVKDEIKKLKNKNKTEEIKNLEEKPTYQTINISINTIINNMIPLTASHIKESNEHLTIDDIDDDDYGYIKYMIKHPLDGRATIDEKEKTVMFKNSDNKLILDVGGRSLLKTISSIDSDKWNKLIGDKRNELCKKQEKSKNLKKSEEYYEKIKEYDEKKDNLTKMATGVDCKYTEKASKKLIKGILSTTVDQICAQIK